MIHKNDPLSFQKKKDTLESLCRLRQMDMLEKLIQQINKDLSLSGVDIQFHVNWSPELLIVNLTKVVKALMEKDFQKFINFLYRIDISEKKLGDITTSDFGEVASEITLMILKKEWQKIWLRNRNSQQE